MPTRKPAARDSKGRFLPRTTPSVATPVVSQSPAPALVREVLPASAAPCVALAIGLARIEAAPTLVREVPRTHARAPWRARTMPRWASSALVWSAVMIPATLHAFGWL